MTDPFTNVHPHLTEVFQRLEAPDDVRARLAQTKLALEVNIPVRMDDGRLQVFKGYRVQFDDTRGPTKGGVRFHPARCMSCNNGRNAWGWNGAARALQYKVSAMPATRSHAWRMRPGIGSSPCRTPGVGFIPSAVWIQR